MGKRQKSLTPCTFKWLRILCKSPESHSNWLSNHFIPTPSMVSFFWKSPYTWLHLQYWCLPLLQWKHCLTEATKKRNSFLSPQLKGTVHHGFQGENSTGPWACHTAATIKKKRRMHAPSQLPLSLQQCKITCTGDSPAYTEAHLPGDSRRCQVNSNCHNY